MPPLDDELRAALSARAATLTPLTDPFPGVARRARTLRRRRTATAVAGSALAVLGLVGGAALVLPGSSLVTPAPPATSPSAAASPAAPTPTATAPGSPYALDPDAPWPYRAAGAPLPESERAVYAQAWADAHPGDSRTPTVLFSQVYEPSGLSEAVVLGGASWGVVRESEAGPEVVAERPLPEAPVTALVDVLGGDEVPRLLVVAAPEVEGLVHRTDPDEPADTALAALAPGVGTVGFEPEDPARDAVVGFAGGQEVLSVPVPDQVAGGEAPTGAPANVQDWPVRGAAVPADLFLRARELLAADRDGVAADEVEGKVLFSGDDDAGNRFLFGQFWVPGDTEAATVGVVDVPEGSDELQLRAPLAPDADVAVFAVSPAPGQSVTTLVVVPRPGTGQVLYAGDDATEWRPVGEGQDGLDGVVLVDRAPAADRGEAVDRIQLLDGDGVLFLEAEVPSLLCGATSCS